MRHHSDRNFAEAEGRPRFIEDREGREAGKGPLVCGGRAEGFFSWRAWIVEGGKPSGSRFCQPGRSLVDRNSRNYLKVC